MDKNLKTTIIIGFALFASFFGAGNLIFPPSIGIAAGDQWPVAMIAFIIAGIILPICSFIVVSRGDGTEEGIAKELGGTVSKVIIALLMVCGSLIIVVPRTAAVTYEIGVTTFIPDFPKVLTSVIFFAIVFLFSVNKSSVMDKVGKFLTPVLLAAMAIIVIKGILAPIAEPVDLGVSGVFASSFIGAYQTLDAIGAIAFSGAIMATIIGKGYTDKKSQRKVALQCAIVAGIGLLFIYGGLCYVGATGSGKYPADMDTTQLLLNLINDLMGHTGMQILAIAVAFACLTTAIGATAGFGSFFDRLTNGKISYKVGVTVICIAGVLISTLSVSQIVDLALPVLLTLYPVVIALILLGLVKSLVPNGRTGMYAGFVYATFIVSFLETVSSRAGLAGLSAMIAKFPLAGYGFAWLIPAVVCGIIGWAATKNSKNPLALKLEDE